MCGTIYNDGKPPGFNGATTFQPWKWSWASCLGSAGPMASMGPRLFSRGNDLGHRVEELEKLSFNGATTFQPWKWYRR